MKFELIFVGKTSEKFLAEGIENYFHKLKHYIPSEIIIIQPLKEKEKFKTEGTAEILKRIKPGDLIILLDEKGKQFNSIDLSKQIQKWMNHSFKKIIFIVGGAYGVDDRIKESVNFIWSLSHLTFTHQMIRLILLEQLFRAMTIIKGESYHHA